MKFKFKLFLLMVGLFVLPISLSSSAYAATVATSQPAIYAKAAIMVDADTGQILYEKNDHQPMAIASISKLMTVYIVHQQIQSGKLHWDDRVKISPAVAKLSTASGLTNVPLKAGHSYSVRALVNAALVVSANAAAIALGQKVAASPQRFANKMTATAKHLGIKDAKFYNAAGLTNKLTGSLALKHVAANAENLLSAKDVALLASRLESSFPAVTRVTSRSQMTFAGKTYPGHNQLLGTNLGIKGARVTGLKTGTSDEAGACFAGSATYRGHRVVTVILGARNNSATDPARFIQTKKLLTTVLSKQTPIKIAKQSRIAGASEGRVPDGKQQTTRLVNQKTTWVWVPKGVTRQQIKGKYVKQPKKITAPEKKGKQVATANLVYDHHFMKYLNTFSKTVNLVTSKSIQKANPFVLIWRALTRLF
ncbi:serine-type D-Ala-D-Ala carboxypeptidase [Lentilactobacillus parafarraginis F0439]|uniref:serine-type D-Ala-D-Ala carboxypeptidase n=1 Tax=Lentilactobacillus parafarraginis F0439 TaxID=797515 RepID=G9ZLB1_9LACO|nr:D-alanyl-D-alanine carboxypeptidase family protein [Lentilactobacillus parafarraginis]EHM00503.1 serine-type D-Ala-D-Ala carboxypeptidase [Lentilactobacillus parafarraginis F0439]